MASEFSIVLTPFLNAEQRPEGTLTFHQLQGFLFTLVCSPEMIKPSEWMPLVFNNQEAGYSNMEEAQSVTQALMQLYNHVNEQVFERRVTFPDGIQKLEPAWENVGAETDLGRWSMGYFMGHSWLEDVWDEYIPEQLSDELGSCMMILSFFSSPNIAQAFNKETKSKRTVEEMAENMLSMFEDAMINYADLGRSIQMATASEQNQPMPFVGEPKVGRNDPCPCGSGKKYKKCCLQ